MTLCLEHPRFPGGLCAQTGAASAAEIRQDAAPSFWRSQHPPGHREANQCEEEEEEEGVASPLCVPGLRFSLRLHVPNGDNVC